MENENEMKDAEARTVAWWDRTMTEAAEDGETARARMNALVNGEDILAVARMGEDLEDAVRALVFKVVDAAVKDHGPEEAERFTRDRLHSASVERAYGSHMSMAVAEAKRIAWAKAVDLFRKRRNRLAAR